MSLLQEMLDAKIISIIRGVASQDIVKAVEALQRGGVRFVEVTYRPGDDAACRDTLRSISVLQEQFGGQMHIGAGTVLSVQQVEDAAQAGAEFIISPNTNTDVIRYTKQKGLISLPGASILRRKLKRPGRPGLILSRFSLPAIWDLRILKLSKHPCPSCACPLSGVYRKRISVIFWRLA